MPENVDRGSLSIQYWVIPVKNIKTVNIDKTFENLINTRYDFRNKPRFTCEQGWKEIRSADGRFGITTERTESCINQVDGTQFNPEGPHTNYITPSELDKYYHQYGPFRMPNAKGQIVEVESTVADIYWHTKSFVTCKFKSIVTRALFKMVNPVTKDELPYLLLMKRVAPLGSVTPASLDPGL